MPRHIRRSGRDNLRRDAQPEREHASCPTHNLFPTALQARRERPPLAVTFQHPFDSTRSRTPAITRRETTPEPFNLADDIATISGRVHAVVRVAPATAACASRCPSTCYPRDHSPLRLSVEYRARCSAADATCSHDTPHLRCNAQADIDTTFPAQAFKRGESGTL